MHSARQAGGTESASPRASNNKTYFPEPPAVAVDKETLSLKVDKETPSPSVEKETSTAKEEQGHHHQDPRSESTRTSTESLDEPVRSKITDKSSSTPAPPSPAPLAPANSNPPSRPRWHPGALFQQVKERIEDHDITKKIKERIEDHEITKKIKQFRAGAPATEAGKQGGAEAASADSASVESSGAAKMDGDSSEREASDRGSVRASMDSEGSASTTPVLRPMKPGLIAPLPPNALYEKAMEWKNKNRDESKKKTMEAHHGQAPIVPKQPLPNFGKVTISDVMLEDLPSWAKRSPYVLFKIENNWDTTPRASSKGPYAWRDWKGKLDVSDLFTDLHMLVFAAKKGSEVLAMEDEYVGKAILPLSNLVLRFREPWLRTLLTGTRRGPLEHMMEICVDLLPLHPKAHSYVRCVTGLPSTGMERPSEPLGRIRLVLNYKMSVSLAKALVAIPPTREVPFPAPIEEMSGALLHQRTMRLKTVLQSYNWVFPTLVEGLLSWENPFATWVWLTIFTQIMLFSEVYHLPFFITLCAVLGSYFVSLLNKKRGKALPPILFSDETMLDPDIPQTLPQKLRALQTLVGGVQRALGIASTALERFFYAFSWDDPFVSLLISMCLLAGGLAVSIVWGLLLHTSFLWRPVLWISGLMIHVPTSMQANMKRRFRSALNKYNARQQKQLHLATAPKDLLGNFPNSIEEMLEDKAVSSIASAKEQDGEEDRLGARDMAKTWKEMIRNLAKRIPDATEIDHRRIALARVWDRKETK